MWIIVLLFIINSFGKVVVIFGVDIDVSVIYIY